MKRTVLLAAADEALTTLSAALRLAGMKVVTVKSGLDAIRKARAACPDLIILDPFLPDLDGPTASDILRRLPSTAGIPILLLRRASGAAGPHDPSELLLQVAHSLALCDAAATIERSEDEARELAHV